MILAKLNWARPGVIGIKNPASCVKDGVRFTTPKLTAYILDIFWKERHLPAPSDFNTIFASAFSSVM